jgi:hypothetical protein
MHTLKIVSVMAVLMVCLIGTSIYVESGKNSKYVYQLFEIVDIKPGHVVEVTFQNVSTTELYKINFIKRYCDNWASISLGSEWSLPVLVKNKDKYILNANLICGD